MSAFSWLPWLVCLLMIVALPLVYLRLSDWAMRRFPEIQSADQLVAMWLLAAAVFLSFVVAVSVVGPISRRGRIRREAELIGLRVAHRRARSLRGMAAKMRSTLSFELVLEAALDVCGMTMEEVGVSARDVTGAVYLYRDQELVPIANRAFLRPDVGRRLAGERGILADAMEGAVPTATSRPERDPELAEIASLRRCPTVVAIPLRAGFQIFGVILIGALQPVRLTEDQLELFDAVADQAVIALQNAQLYQRLEAEKERIIEAEEEARHRLARELHDGPTQSVATIAMRINFIRSLLKRDPDQAMVELAKVEEMAKDTSREIRGMLFALRPLPLASHGLAAAVEMELQRLRENHGIATRLTGGEFADLINEQSQQVVFQIIEEAIGNARKHARASLVEVQFAKQDDLFVARVIDDGVGFDAEAVINDYTTRGSLGMINMSERADLVDGSVQVQSERGKGTRITLIIPLKEGRSTLTPAGAGIA